MKHKCYRGIQQNELYINSFRAIIYNEEINAEEPGCISWYFDYYEMPNSRNEVLLKEHFNERPSSGALDILRGNNTIGNTLELVKDDDFNTIPEVLRCEIQNIISR